MNAIYKIQLYDNVYSSLGDIANANTIFDPFSKIQFSINHVNSIADC